MAAPVPIRLWLVLSVLALACALLPAPAWIFEQFYSRDTFPALQAGFTALSNRAPFAVLDLLIGATALLVLWRLFRLLMVARSRGAVSVLAEVVRRVLRFAAAVVIVFFVAWGFNYRRLPLEDTVSGMASGSRELTRVTAAFDDANSLAGRLHATVRREAPLDDEALVAALIDPMQMALVKLSRPPLSTPSVPKHSVFVQPFFEKAGFDGMINPLALETILHQGLLPFERPFVLAHEWAHLAGHADEAEASAVGWLACMQGGSALAYSASLYLIMQTQAAMPPDARRQALGRLHPGVREDLAAMVERVRQDEVPRVQQAAERVYDEYLRANRVEEGTASYGRALELILSDPFRQALRGYR